MVNINLATEDFNSQSAYSYKRGVAVLSIILSLVVLAYIGLVVWQNQLKKQLNRDISGTVAAQYAEAEQVFSQSGNSRRVLDFQNRLQVAGTLFNSGRPVMDNFKEVESSMVNGVYLDAFDFDVTAKLISISGTASNFNDLANQILVFKEAKNEQGAKYFTVTTGKTIVDKDGKIRFNLTLKQN